MTIAQRLQAAGISFVDVQASHKLVTGRVRIISIVLSSDADLMKFATWAGENDVDFDGARVATPAELDEQMRWS